MPYKSTAQVRFMHAKHPDIAKRWDKKYGVSKHLPQHVNTMKKALKVEKDIHRSIRMVVNKKKA